MWSFKLGSNLKSLIQLDDEDDDDEIYGKEISSML